LNLSTTTAPQGRAAIVPTDAPPSPEPKLQVEQQRSGVIEGWPKPMPPSRIESQSSKRFPAPERSCGMQASFRGVWHPTTLVESGSDLHQVCLTWLCCAFRFSQPLDALFRPRPLQPCFMPVTPLGFRFQRFSLSGSGRRLSTPPSLRAVSNDRHATPARMVTSRPATTRVYAPGESVPTGPVLPGIRRPILS
jgi:hypothetical protein